MLKTEREGGCDTIGNVTIGARSYRSAAFCAARVGLARHKMPGRYIDWSRVPRFVRDDWPLRRATDTQSSRKERGTLCCGCMIPGVVTPGYSQACRKRRGTRSCL
jgi:hypothetical protein